MNNNKSIPDFRPEKIFREIAEEAGVTLDNNAYYEEEKTALAVTVDFYKRYVRYLLGLRNHTQKTAGVNHGGSSLHRKLN